METNCLHGERKYIAKVGPKGPWRALFCPTEKGTPDQCPPVFLDDGQQGPDGSTHALEATGGAQAPNAPQTGSQGVPQASTGLLAQKADSIVAALRDIQAELQQLNNKE